MQFSVASSENRTYNVNNPREIISDIETKKKVEYDEYAAPNKYW